MTNNNTEPNLGYVNGPSYHFNAHGNSSTPPRVLVRQITNSSPHTLAVDIGHAELFMSPEQFDGLVDAMIWQQTVLHSTDQPANG